MVISKQTYAFMAAAAYDERRGSANDEHTKAIEDYLKTQSGGEWDNETYQPVGASPGWNNADGASYSDPATGMQADVWTKGSEYVIAFRGTEGRRVGVPACITHAISRSITILAAAIVHLGVISSAAQAGTGLVECYGETLEVSMIARMPTDTDDGRIVLSLPNPVRWGTSFIKEAPQYGGNLRDAPCLEEPVFVSRARGTILDDRIRRIDIADPGRPPKIRQQTGVILIYGGQTLSSLEGHERFWLELLLAEGVPVEDGFIQRIPVSPNHKANGSFLFPETYLTPLGLRMIAHNSWSTGTIEYRLAERLKIEYRFWTTHEYSPDLIELDQTMREIFNEWIVEPEE